MHYVKICDFKANMPTFLSKSLLQRRRQQPTGQRQRSRLQWQLYNKKNIFET